jgi:hypothetical protein
LKLLHVLEEFNSEESCRRIDADGAIDPTAPSPFLIASSLGWGRSPRLTRCYNGF